MNKKTNKIIKTLLLFLVIALTSVLSSCGVKEVGCSHKYECTSHEDAKSCQEPGYEIYTCKKCNDTYTKKLIIEHEVADKSDYINLQLCSKCGQLVRMNSTESAREKFYYHYNDKMMEDFKDALQIVYDELEKAESKKTELFKTFACMNLMTAFSNFLTEFDKIQDQYSAAEVDFYSSNNETTTANKDTAEKAYNECRETYRQLYYDLFHSSLRDILFEGEDIEKIEKQIENFKNPQIKELENSIDEMEHDLFYNEISDSEFNVGYKKLVDARQELAQLYNYNNYYEYAHTESYGRQYSIDQLTQYRSYVKKYLTGLAHKYELAYQTGAGELGAYNALLKYCDGSMVSNQSATQVYVKYLKEMSTADLNFYDKVNQAFKDGRVYFSSSDGVEAGFTNNSNVLGKNYMFFYNGSYYACPFTFVHETGHFMFEQYNTYNDYDLFEVQSQTNEVMFLLYLQNYAKINVNGILPYKLYAMYSTVLETAAIDEFEYCIYTNYSDLADKYKDGIDANEYEDLYADVLAQYNLSAQQMTNYYWHYYCTQQSVYEIAYSISCVPVLGQYYDSLSSASFDDLKKEYIDIVVLKSDELLTFEQALSQCGFHSPFDEETYKIFN